MTSVEMENEFLIHYDKITNFDAPGYESDEISRFLTQAQERLILHIVNPRGNKYVTGIEVTEKRRKDLSELHRDGIGVISANQTGSKADGTFFDLPTDFLYTLQEEATISSTSPCYDGDTGVEVKPITHDLYIKNRKNPHKKPYGELIWRMDFSRDTIGTGPKRHELITDAATTVTTYSFRYLRRPQPIISDTSIIEGLAGPLDCELDTIMHRAIIDEAVAIATGITSPELWQLGRQEASLSE
jgi:hypothetical protein